MKCNNNGSGSILLAGALGVASLILIQGTQSMLQQKARNWLFRKNHLLTEKAQTNSVVIAEKLLRTGLTRESVSGWVPTDEMRSTASELWSLTEGIGPSQGRFIITQCHPSQNEMLFTSQDPTTCHQSLNTEVNVLGRRMDGSLQFRAISSVSLGKNNIKKDEQYMTSNIPRCFTYSPSGTLLVKNIYKTILGRRPTHAEMEQVLDCVAKGNLQPWELEGAQTNLCNGKARGLRSLPEYDRRLEAINVLYRIHLGRLPMEREATQIDQYFRTLSVSESRFADALKTVRNQIRTDYQLGETPLFPQLVVQLYAYIFQKAYSVGQTNPYLLMLADGEATLETTVALMRDSLLYRAQNPERTTGQARRSEAANFLFFALAGQHLHDFIEQKGTPLAHPMDAANWWGDLAWTVDTKHTDPLLDGYQWLSQTWRYSDSGLAIAKEIANQGVCLLETATRPQCTITSSGIIDGQTSSSYENGKMCGTPPNHTYIPSSENCPLGKTTRLVKIPKAAQSARLRASAFIFGYVTDADVSYSKPGTSTRYRIEPDANPRWVSQVRSSVYEFTDFVERDDLSGTCSVAGLGGRNSQSFSVTVPKQKKSCLVATTNRTNSSGLLQWYVWAPAPPVETLASVDDWAYRKILPFEGDSIPTNNDLSAAPENIRVGPYSDTNPIIDQIILRNATLTTLSGSILGPQISNFVQNISSPKGGYFDARNFYHRIPAIPKTVTIGGFEYTIRTDPQDYLISTDQYANSTWGSADCTHVGSQISPLAIDLHNEGILFSRPGKGVTFDLGLGKNQSYFWIENGENTAFLSYDKNGNGEIDSIQELFGDRTVGPDQKTESNGFLALKKYDGNADGKIDRNDAIFGSLLLWFDRNRNGISEKGELVTLSAAGTRSVRLNYDNIEELEDAFGNLSRQRSKIEMLDGALRNIHDLYFTQNGIY